MLSKRTLVGGRWGLGIILTILAGFLASADFGRGPVAARSAEEAWRHLTLIYHSDCKGKIEPCG